MMREVGGELRVSGVQNPRKGVYFKKPGTVTFRKIAK